jgi:hypothetical protein
MDAGLPRLEFETHGRIASAVRKTRRDRASCTQYLPFRAVPLRDYPYRRLKSDRLLATWQTSLKWCNTEWIIAIYGKFPIDTKFFLVYFIRRMMAKNSR